MKEQKFEDFFNHKEDTVSTAARFLADVQAQYVAGNITKQEYEELVIDAVEIKDVYGLAGDLDRKVTITLALNTLQSIAAVIPT